VAFSPNGNTLAASGGTDTSVLLWDVRDPARPQRLGQPLTGDTTAFNAVAFAPEGIVLAGGGYDGSILWSIADLLFDRDHIAQIACARSGGGFNLDEWTRFVGNLPYENPCTI
jgi:WD40 repeat protein